jgi:hypothetical protein
MKELERVGSDDAAVASWDTSDVPCSMVVSRIYLFFTRVANRLGTVYWSTTWVSTHEQVVAHRGMLMSALTDRQWTAAVFAYCICAYHWLRSASSAETASKSASWSGQRLIAFFLKTGYPAFALSPKSVPTFVPLALVMFFFSPRSFPSAGFQTPVLTPLLWCLELITMKLARLPSKCRHCPNAKFPVTVSF